MNQIGGQRVGEVNIRVKLINATDEVNALTRPGRKSKVRSVEVDAVVDTGAVALIIPPFIANQLGLLRFGKQNAQYADGRSEEVDVAGPLFIEVMNRRTTEEALVLGNEVLIGQTVLEKTDLLVDCREQKLVPNPAHPNQPVIKVITAKPARPRRTK
jgi:clan AA aspartic protease